MVDVFGHNDEYRIQIYLSILFVASCIGCIASAMMILIIRRMRPMTSHVYLIYCMSLFQLLYNAVFFFKDGTAGFGVKVFATVVFIFCGIATSFLSNWIALSVFSTVIYRKKFDVFQNLLKVHLSNVIPATIVSALYLISVLPRNRSRHTLNNILVEYVYNFIRFGSILVNFVLIAATTVYVSQMFGRKSNPTSADVAIVTLCKRMVFYPIIQTIGRAGSAWYDLAYGLDYDPTHPGDIRYSSLLFMVVITPLVSVGYFVVFLWMQPKAWKHLCSLFRWEASTRETMTSSSQGGAPSPVKSAQSADTRSMTSELSMIRGQYASTLDDSELESELASHGASSFELHASGFQRYDTGSVAYSNDFRFGSDGSRNTTNVPSMTSIENPLRPTSV